MLKYTDAQGRLHFTQDIGQVPPEYRSQVEKKVLKGHISVTGGSDAGSKQRRLDAIKKRSERLKSARRAATKREATPAKRARARTPEPKKYATDCSDYTTNGRCRKTLTAEWAAWDAANGGDNGKPVTRRRIGRDGR